MNTQSIGIIRFVNFWYTLKVSFITLQLSNPGIGYVCCVQAYWKKQQTILLGFKQIVQNLFLDILGGELVE